jgi:hypothetical protein
MKIIVLLIALVFLAACERPYDGEKNYYRRKTSRSKRKPIANQGFKFMLRSLQVYLALAEISYGKTNADGRFKLAFFAAKQ